MDQPFRQLGVIGAGQMGSGIVEVAARAGLKVTLFDAQSTRALAAVNDIAARLDKARSRTKITAADREAALSRISVADHLETLSPCDLVIEAATENEAVQQSIYAALKPVLSDDAVLATNTSSLSITRLGATTARPDRFIGIHFMNPVPVMQLVELIRGIQTSQETFEAARAFAEALGKTVAVSEDFPAFIVNRVLMPMINEACYTLYEGVGTVESIDTAMKLGANHPMGPLELADFIGLDTCLAIMRVLHEELADTKYRPCPLLTKYVEAGWLGRKNGRGFYDYRSGTPEPTR